MPDLDTQHRHTPECDPEHHWMNAAPAPLIQRATGPAVPSYATVPTIGARHDLYQIELTARVLGTPLMPWQRFVARVASERHPDNPAKFRYHTVILTVPRQSGKTTLMRTLLAQRALMTRNRQAFYTAQTGKDATARWKDLIKQIESSVLREHVHTRLSQGSQSLDFPNGSFVAPFAPTPKSLHGYTPHDVMLDEIFEWDSEQGEALMGAVKPAQQTLVDRQLWLVSTMGTKDSDFLNGWIDKGRAAVNNPESGIAYFEWSLAPGLDEYDPANWGFHPALGHTIQIDALQEATSGHSVGEWNRAYMNRQTETMEEWLSDDVLDTVMRPVTESPDLSRVHFAFDIDPKPGGGAAIVAAWLDDAGRPHAKIYRTDSGRRWLLEPLAELCGRYPAAVAYDDNGNNRTISALIDGGKMEAVNTQTFITAGVNLKDLIESGGITIDDSPLMRRAIQSVATRSLGESWAFSRKNSTGDISLAVALAIAVKSAMHERSMPAPLIHF